jgi:DNA invertase Pin-like site-specific DNA recombinase
MAEQGRKIDEYKQREIRRLAQVNSNRSEVAKLANVSRPTVYKYAQKKSSE